MSALRKPLPETPATLAPATEVIYLLVPPTPSRPQENPWTAREKASLALLNFRLRSYDSPVGKAMRAVGLVAGYALVGIPLLFGAYCAKSAIGFDLIPGRSIVKEIAPSLHYDGPVIGAVQ